jgi:hypothetical protein
LLARLGLSLSLHLRLGLNLLYLRLGLHLLLNLRLGWLPELCLGLRLELLRLNLRLSGYARGAIRGNLSAGLALLHEARLSGIRGLALELRLTLELGLTLVLPLALDGTCADLARAAHAAAQSTDRRSAGAGRWSLKLLSLELLTLKLLSGDWLTRELLPRELHAHLAAGALDDARLTVGKLLLRSPNHDHAGLPAIAAATPRMARLDVAGG